MAGCFQIDERDNMATLLRDAAVNADETRIEALRAAETIPAGHKVALAALVAATASGAATKPEAPRHREYFLMTSTRTRLRWSQAAAPNL